jgi:hypothetical protein
MRIAMIFAVLAAMSVMSPAADAKVDPPQRSIMLSADRGPFVFGRAVSLTVSYRNGGQEPWEVPTPSESTSVGLRRRPSGTEQHPGGYDFGRRTITTIKGPDGQEITARVVPIPKPITIAPGQSHDFKVLLERDWSGNLKPGLWTVWVEDHKLEMESNRLEMPLVFTADSLTACLEIAADDKQRVSKRKAHAIWLQKIMPELNCRWWYDDTPAPERQAMEAEVQRQLAAFRAWWLENSKAVASEAAISAINREAGVEPRQ